MIGKGNGIGWQRVLRFVSMGHLELGAAEVDEGGGAEARLQPQPHPQVMQLPLPAHLHHHLRAHDK